MKSRLLFLNSLFLKYQADLQRFIAHRFGDPEDAEDIVQDAFHNFLRIDAPENLENPRAYLYQTALNLALNRIRKQRRHDNFLSLCHENEASSPLENTLGAYQDLERVENALSKLPATSRKAFLLNRVHAKTYSEISEELNISISTVEKHMIRTLRFLRDHLDRVR